MTKQKAIKKVGLHPRNKHQGRYDLKQLAAAYAPLGQFIVKHEKAGETIDFFNAEAVKSLNKALLKHYYGMDYWDIPKEYLCPPIPGRADYIHHAADLVLERFTSLSEEGLPQITCLDVGVGANCVYPIIGVNEYDWSFIGSDIDRAALQSAWQIVRNNEGLKEKVQLRLQTNKKHFFKEVLQPNEKVELVICNPPFYGSQSESEEATLRKLRNLSKEKIEQVQRNFGGQSQELWCKGGEQRFVKDLIFESRPFAKSCFWFTCLISKEAHLKSAYQVLKTVGAHEVKTIAMGQGHKVSRILAWTFLKPDEQWTWMETK